MAIAELCVARKPVLFVPYPYAAEDHQTVNAKNLVNKNAALMIKDEEALDTVVPAIIELANDNDKQNELKRNIGMLAVTDADRRIAEEVLRVI
jgi:UDP-N-acetylglucosamine--N-acetylmuramyl-(pentapeptide) pyrophosphoryl-undecaprenol N-acetylglucosamine transferase